MGSQAHNNFYINVPSDILSKAGQGYSLHQARFGPSGAPVLLECTDENTPLIHQLLGALNKIRPDTIGRWIRFDGEATEADLPYPKVPKICISQAFEYKGTGFEDYSPHMSFLYVVQGINGMAKLKVVLTTDVYTAAAGMIHEALNGYSITFSASMHSETAAVVFGSYKHFTEHQFVRVRTWQEVVDSGRKNIISMPQNSVCLKTLRCNDQGKAAIKICC